MLELKFPKYSLSLSLHACVHQSRGYNWLFQIVSASILSTSYLIMGFHSAKLFFFYSGLLLHCECKCEMM
uniref:Uncharacterized protein n=1 Tax=Rhizophora mucronata TaxID=61149 RepID=A0A2P2QG88_RHIMU